MKQKLDQIFSRCGQAVTANRRGQAEAVEIRAFLQPVLRHEKEAPLTATPLGGVCREQWLYLGPGDFLLSPGDQLTQGTMSLIVQESRAVYWQDAVLYHWALLRRRKEAAPCIKD